MIKENEVVYLSGPIAGNDGFYFDFADAMIYLNLIYKCITLNPAMLPHGLAYEQYMTIDLAMVEVCDVIVMLPGWNNSNGARREHKRALELDKRIIEYGDLT